MFAQLIIFTSDGLSDTGSDFKIILVGNICTFLTLKGTYIFKNRPVTPGKHGKQMAYNKALEGQVMIIFI